MQSVFQFGVTWSIELMAIELGPDNMNWASIVNDNWRLTAQIIRRFAGAALAAQ